MLPPRNVTFLASASGATLSWEPPDDSSAPVTGWQVRVGSFTPFQLPAQQRSTFIALPSPTAETVELRTLSDTRSSEPVLLTGLRAASPVNMAAWVLTDRNDLERRVRLSLWSATPMEVRLSASTNGQPATLGAALPTQLRVGPEPVSLEVPWSVGRDCSGDRADLLFTAHVGPDPIGQARATAWLRACAATGMTALLPTGEWPSALHPLDMDGDGRQELLVAHENAPWLLVLSQPGDDYRRQYVHVGRPSDWMHVRDLNADGRSDIVLLARGSAEVLVLFGRRDGLFEPPRAFALAIPATDAAFADVDADGQHDILAFNRLAHRYQVLAGQPDGSFKPLAHGTAPEAATGLLVGDFTDDGRPDVSWRGAHLLAVGDGQGHFPRTLPLAPELLVEAADVDEDGQPELLALEQRSGWMSLSSIHLEPGGALSFRQRTTSSTLEEAFSGWLRVADFNGDGLRDFVFLASGSDSSLLCLQSQEGTCTGRPLYQGYGHSARDAVRADLDGDGLPELVFAVEPGPYAPGHLRVFRVRGTTVSSAAIVRVENPVLDVAFVDSNADGRREVVIGGYQVSLLSEDRSEVRATYEVGGTVAALAAGDFTGDGRADLAVFNERRQVFLLIGQGAGAFERTAAPLITLPGEGPMYRGARLHAGDFNRDGRADLLHVGPFAGRATLLTSSGPGFTLSQPFSQPTWTAAVADLDRDGGPDVVLSGETGVVSYLSRPDGTFLVAWKDLSVRHTSLLLRDFTADGVPDLVLSQGLLLGMGDGRFQQGPAGPVSSETAVAAGDWNGDGRTDLLCAEDHGMGTGRSTTYLQGSDGRFTETQGSLSPNTSRGAWAVDLEGDAQDELLLATTNAYEPVNYWRLELFRLPRAP